MATLSAGDLVSLRTKIGASSFYLSVFTPVTLLSATVTGSPDRGARSISYNSGTGSGFSTIEAYQLVEIDTATGTRRVRLKGISGNQTSGTLFLDENAILASNGDTVRVLHFYPLVAVPPSIRSQTFFKFYDTSYNDNQNLTPNPVCIIGSHLVGRLSSGSVVFQLNSSSSYAVAQGASISSRVWSCLHNGGGSTGITFSSTTAANPTITLTDGDSYILKCVVTDSNGKTQAGYRVIFAHDADYLPYQDFTVQSLSGDWQRGGWSCSIQATGDVTLADFPDMTLAVLWYDNTFNNVTGYVDLWGTATRQIVCAGYIRKDQDNDKLSDGTHWVGFEITTPEGVMDNMSELGSISLNAVAGPTKWYQYASWMTVGRAVHHLLKWHSSVLETCDVLGLTANTLGVKNADFAEPSLLQMINGLAYQRGVFAKLVSARTGRLYFVEDSQMLNTAARAALDTVFTLALADVSDLIDVVRSPEERISTATLDGFSFDGSTGTALISIAPGYRESSISYGMPEFRGTAAIQVKGQVLDDQTDSNEKVGRVLAQANNNPYEIRLTTPYNGIGAFDIVPSIGWYVWGIANNALARDTVLNGTNLLCRSVTHQINHDQGTVATEVVFEIEAIGPDGIQGNYPTSYPTPKLRAPTWTPPVVNSSIILTYADSDDSDQGKAVIVTVSGTVITPGSTATFETGTTSWTSVCALSSTQALVCYRDEDDSNQGKAVVLDISGTTITPATPAVFETGNTTHIDVCALSATQALVCYRDEDNSNRGTACILDISGSTITPGTPAVFETDNTLYISVTRLTATRAFVCYSDGGAGAACVLDVSGSTITPGASAVFFNAGTIFRAAVDALSSTSVIVAIGIDVGQSVGGFVLYNIGSGYTSGGGYTIDNVNGAFDTAEPGNHWLRAIGSTGAILAYQSGNFGGPDPFNIFATALDIAGTIITPGTPVQLSDNSYDEVATAALVNSTQALVFYGDQAVDGNALTISLAGTTVTSDANETDVSANYVRYTSSAVLG
jgi:hypothetical protein